MILRVLRPSILLRGTGLLQILLLLVLVSAAARMPHSGSLRASDAAGQREGLQWDQRYANAPLQQELLTQKVLSSYDETESVDVKIREKLSTAPQTLHALLQGLAVMQDRNFEIWQGTWPKAIDWTAAVMGTHISATLHAITADASLPSLEQENCALSANATVLENLINRYFTHITTFYFGENAFSLRMQAYDDMLWVVLGWLEGINFINAHTASHYMYTGDDEKFSWYGNDFIPAFAHRARIFWELASQGWDTSLCAGGMLWNPRLTPYKNAITNQLYISASMSMYLYFPGDDNESPYRTKQSTIPPAPGYDPKYLEAAIEGYKWLSTSNMTNEKGLFADGFHIRGWRGGGHNGSIGSGKCDVRDEMVYTYNQGVLLTGLRGLWHATGARSYLEDGHELIRNVIAATGWHVEDPEQRRKWHGIGRNGIMEESCDARGDCSQDSQTFKGIFFHHTATFCAPLPANGSDPVLFTADAELSDYHLQSCQGYAAWVQHNAQAAYNTRDEDGRFGMWWVPGLWRSEEDREYDYEVPQLGTDYRNKGVPRDSLWQLPGQLFTQPHPTPYPIPSQKSLWESRDPNNRGRGRTVETQSGGVSVIRAWYKSLSNVDDDGTVANEH
ncbi:MAG: hypothetical protein MMC33_005156 [Icmadophila ericetorum]|nr:hypothetical protein [Icmadophila ericetorum]